MDQMTWLSRNGKSLEGKTILITGATGGLGSCLCRMVLSLSGKLLLLNRDPEKLERFCRELRKEFPEAEISWMSVDFSDMASVEELCGKLEKLPVDVLIHNAGIYQVPRKKCTSGYENVFQVNFVTPYYITKRLMPLLSERRGTVVAVGSVAHTYSKTDPQDVDFSGRKPIHLVYGNSKRYLMFALWELFRQNSRVRLCVCHPGIAVTNITNHYPRWLYALIRRPMKVIFMRPEKAARSILMGIFENAPYLHWIGPRFFHVWGNPKVEKVRTCDAQERSRIFEEAEKIYRDLCAEFGRANPEQK